MIRWGDLPESYKNHVANPDVIKIFEILGGQFIKASNKRDGVRYYASISKYSMVRIKDTSSKHIDDVLYDMILGKQGELVKNPTSWGPHADTRAAKYAEKFAYRFVDAILKDCPYLSRSDFDVVWVKGTETPFLVTKLAKAQFFQLTEQTANKIKKSLSCASNAQRKVSETLVNLVGEEFLRKTFLQTFDSLKAKYDTNAYEYLGVQKLQRIGFIVNDIFGPFDFFASGTLLDNSPFFLQTPVSSDKNIDLKTRVAETISKINIKSVLRTAKVLPNTTLDNFLRQFDEPKPVIAKDKNVTVVLTDAKPRKEDDRYLIAVGKNKNYKLLTQEDKAIRFRETGNGFERILDAGSENIDPATLANKIAAALLDMRIVEFCPFQFTVTAYRASAAVQAIDIQVVQNGKIAINKEKIPVRTPKGQDNITISSITSILTDTFSDNVKGSLFDLMVENGLVTCHLGGEMTLLKRDLLLFISHIQTAWEYDDGFVKLDVLNKFPVLPEAADYTKARISETLDDLLRERVIDNAGFYNCFLFDSREVSATRYSFNRYSFFDEDMTKCLLSSLKDQTFQFTDLVDIKSSLRPKKFKELMVRAGSSEAAFEVISHLDLLTQKDAASIIRSKEFPRILSLLTPEDRLFAAITIRNYPGCTKIANELENAKE